MALNFKIKNFHELTIHELYEILQLRSEVFVVEQNCVYQDIDGKDTKAMHLIGTMDNKIVAYARLFNKGQYFENASIGRVVVDSKHRNLNFGHDLMRNAMDAIKQHFETTKISISAQLYLKKFYESHGFTQIGDGYLEDGIPHIKMIHM
jgi:ElaA protein